MATYRGLTIQSGVYKQIQDSNTLGVGGGIAAQTAAQTLTITAGAGANIVANSLFDPSQGIDRSTATTMYIGATNATTVYIGRSGQTTQIVGDLNVQGTETVVGISTFQNNAVFEGDVDLGNAATDTVTFVAEVDSNIVFKSGANRNLYIATPAGAGTAGNNISVFGAFGAAGSGNNGGAGGQGIFAGGKGGDGDTGFSGGTGGTAYLLGGQGGAPNGGTPGAGGTVLIDAGVPGTGGTNGEVDVGGTNADIVRLGRSGQSTLVRGNLSVNGNTTLGDASSDTITFTGVVDTNIIFEKEANYNIQVQTSTTSNASGGNITVQAGLADGNGNGGTIFVYGGAAPSNGAGGNVVIEGGTSVGGNPGFVSIAPTDSAGVTIGHASITTSITGSLSQQTGTFGLQGNGASSLSTTAGLLTVDGAGGISLKGGGTTALAINSTGTVVTSSADIIPSANDTYKLGQSGAIWSEVWCDVLNANSSNINGTTNLTFEVNTDAAGGTDENPALWLTGGDGTAVHRTYMVQDSNSTYNTTYVYRTEAGTEIGFEFAVGNPGSAVASLDQRLAVYGTNGSSVVKAAVFNWDATNQVLRLNDNGAEGDVTTTELRTNVILGDTSNPTDNTVNIQAYLQPNASLPNLIFSYAAGTTHRIQVESATGSNAGGGLGMTAGTGGPTNGAGGDLDLWAGNAGGGNANGGDAYLRGGNGSGTGTDGNIYIGDQNTSNITIGGASSGLVSIQGNTGGITLAGAGTALVINAAGTAVTVQAGVTLATTGSGNINLPNNGSARFQIESTSVGSTVTAPNLDTLTNGSNADALHTHSGVSASSVAITKTADENLSAGNLLALGFNGGTPICNKADANGAGTRTNAVGFTAAAVTASNPATIVVSGEVAVADASWDSVPTTSDVGAPVYMSETAGNVTLTAPSTSGSTVQKVGIVSVGGTGAVKVLVQIGDGVVLA
jgi:hypothetical protein